jgi:hypothetical protein
MLDQATPCEGVCEICQGVTKWDRRQIVWGVSTRFLSAGSLFQNMISEIRMNSILDGHYLIY